MYSPFKVSRLEQCPPSYQILEYSKDNDKKTDFRDVRSYINVQVIFFLFFMIVKLGIFLIMIVNDENNKGGMR